VQDTNWGSILSLLEDSSGKIGHDNESQRKKETLSLSGGPKIPGNRNGEMDALPSVKSCLGRQFWGSYISIRVDL